MTDWIERKLSDVCRISIGGTPSRGVPEYWDKDLLTTNYWASIKDLNKKIIDDTAERITHKGVLNSNAKFIKKGTVLMSFKLSIGKVAYSGKDLYTNEAIAAFEEPSIDNRFLYHGLQQWDLLQDVDQAVKGVTLNKQKLKRIKFYAPSSKIEQATIANVLDYVDYVIDKKKQLIAKYERIKTGLMQDLLTRGIDEEGNIRSADTHEFKDSPLGRIPNEWEVYSINNVCSDVVDCPHSTPTYLKGGILVARTMHIKEGSYDNQNSSYVSEAEYNERIHRLEPLPGDLIFTREAPVGEAFVIPEGMRICLGQRVMQLRPNLDYTTPEFILELIYSPLTRLRFDAIVGGTTNPHLNVADVKKFEFAFPKTNEQKRISDSLNKIRQLIQKERDDLNKYLKIRTALMQDLLTGKVRVDSLMNQPAEIV